MRLRNSWDITVASVMFCRSFERFTPAQCLGAFDGSGDRARRCFRVGAHSVFGDGFGNIYNDWAAANFADIPAQSGVLADPDGDGEANLIEFAFGTDPRAGWGESLAR